MTKAKLVKIGNSKGIRIPKVVLEQCDFGEVVHLEVVNNTLVISSPTGVRKNWDAAFQAMAQAGDDKLLDIGEIQNEWDETEWHW